MRIGVNALYLIPGGVGGTEIYLRRLLCALGEIDPVNRYYVFTNAETDAALVPRRPNFTHVPQSVPARFRPARIAWEQTVLPFHAARLRLDVLLNPGFTAPAYSPCPCVTVFHDLQHLRHPEYFRWFDLPFWRALLFASAQLSRTVLAVSEATAADLRRYYRLPAANIRTVHHGVDAEFFALDRSGQEAMLLCVSTLHPHKNIDRLLRAFAVFRRTRPEFRLVLAGMRGFHGDVVESLRAQLGLQDAVELTGWIERPRLMELYARAAAFVYPSSFEGFGMPVLEAMAAGLPVACSRIPPLEEIGADAVRYFDPEDVDDLVSALFAVTGDESVRRDLACRGPRRAAGFSWTEAARKTLAALEAV